ncbi:phosphoesterase family-domain-containing protein [Pseudohyphozyma bogoriensis]|nr:phosphoesterase family-domain-containing protein [Pseudohyphozyma bogoriensis]
MPAALFAAAALALVLPFAAAVPTKDSLATIEHVVLYMQENRAFDHYFGTLAGVRGFHDPNVQINADGRFVFYQKVNGSLSNATDYLLPFYAGYQGEANRSEAIQCTEAGSNSYAWNEAAENNGENNMWALENTPYSIEYLKRSDIPLHYQVADEWTVGDMYQQGVVASTNPNRVMWGSGSINIPGGNVNSTQGPVLDNNVTPGTCDALTMSDFGGDYTSAANYSCFPFDWKTTGEYLAENGVSWTTFQAYNNFGDNPWASFKNYIDPVEAGDLSNVLVKSGMEFQPYANASAVNASLNPAGGYPDNADMLGYNPSLIVDLLEKANKGGESLRRGLLAFEKACAEGTLPAVSYIIGPSVLTEHPPYLPQDGAWYSRRIIEAVQKSPKYSKTVLIQSYDETGGFADHVVPVRLGLFVCSESFHSPEGTPGEWIVNPFTNKSAFAGPGFRLPFMVVSPWTRGGNVFTAPSDHTSQIMFLEKWLAAKGKPFFTKEINDWRREHMSDLVDLFDFDNPDYKPVDLVEIREPHSTDGVFDGNSYCADIYPEDLIYPTIPYGIQDAEETLFQETGFKAVRGALTEGRYLIFEMRAYSLAYIDGELSAQLSAKHHNKYNARIVVEATNPLVASEKTFRLRFSSLTGANAYLTSDLKLTTKADAEVFTVSVVDATSYHVQTSEGKYLSIIDGKVELSAKPHGFSLFSVSF